jgi:hypothetical protein
MRWTTVRAVTADGRGNGDAGVAGWTNRVRRGLGLAALAIAVASGESGADEFAAPPTDPTAFVLSAGGDLYVGNGTRVPGPIGANGAMLLDERVRAPLAVARRDAKLRLLATVDGDLLSITGSAQLANQVHVRGGIGAARGVVVGVSARVDGAVMAPAGPVRVTRLATVAGNVSAAREFRGERDVVIGVPGSRVEVRGDAIIRDRSEYFATVAYEGTLSVVGTGAPVFHAAVLATTPGTLAVPVLPEWKLSALAVPAADAGSEDVTVTQGSSPMALAPGRYGVLTLEQEGEVTLSPGVYEIDELDTQSDARVHLALAGAADTIALRVRHDVRPGRRFVMDVGTTDPAVRRERASRVSTAVGGLFRGDQDVVWSGGLVAGKGISLGKHTTLVGAAWTKGNLRVGRDSVIDWVPLLPAE